MSKITLVTGATGFTGGHLTQRLAKRGNRVRALVRSNSSVGALSALGIEIVEGDLVDAASVQKALEGVDTVIHSAGFIWFGWTKLRESLQVNLDITTRIARLCRERDLRMVHVSSVDALPVGEKKEVMDEQSEGKDKLPCNYVVSKRAADMAVYELVSKGLDASIVHPSLMFGPRDWKPSSGELM